MVKYSRDKKCKYYDGVHTYRVGKEQYESVTTLVSRHFPKFNDKKLARYLASLPFAKKQKKGVRYWLNDWKKNREEGLLIHAELEKLVNNPEEYQSLKPVLHPRTIIAWEGFHKLHKQFDEPVLHPEEIVYNEKYKVAGQIDLLIEENGEGTERVVSLLDWKATKEIDDHYKYDNEEEKYGTTVETMHLENCRLNKYTLQLSLYAYMLELQGYKIKDLYIGHICPKKDTFVPIKVQYMKYIIESILDDKYLEEELE
jgi:ATP-dependent exoDNAse (exonuclease V) beta subunit